MAYKIIINTERCKGCGLCVGVCPKECISVSQDSNKGGYFPAEFDEERCTGCANCAIICPEAVIEIYKDETVVASAELKPEEQGGQRITEIRPKQKKSALTKERT